jgi:hypothetical protein
LLLSLSLSLVACGDPAPEIVTEGLTVLETPTVPPSEAAVAEAEEVLYPLFLFAAEQKLGSAVPPGTQKTVAAHAKEVARLLSESGTGDAGYRAVTAILARDGEAAVAEWFGGSEEGYPRLRALYLSLTEHLPTEAIADLAYALLDYSYTFRTEAAREDWEKHKDRPLGEWCRQKYEALAAEHATFRPEIDGDCFSAAFRTLLMLSDLFAKAEGDTAALTAFTPTELTVFLRLIPFEEIETSPEGYELLLSLAARKTGGGMAFLLSVAEEAGDLSHLASVTEGLITLAAHLRNAVGEEEALLLQGSEHEKLLSALFAELPDGDWDYLASLAALPLSREAYAEAAALRWEDYTAYAAALVPITAEELRAAAGTDGFAALLPRYLANITPVLSYCYENR